MKKALVIIPTYNESENVKKIIQEVLKQNSMIDVLIVDDNSPDGTGEIVKKIKKKNSKVHLIERASKNGLGTAYIAGFKFALENKYNYIFEMDADFSHDPNDIPRFLKTIQNCDVVLGSRYVGGVSVVNWPIKRLLLSYFANKYSKFITGLPVCDATSGFKCFRREVLENIQLDEVKSNGYAFQIEVSFMAWKKKFRIAEIPIIFIDRRVGTSKMSKKIVHEAAFMVLKLRTKSIFGKI